MDARSLIEIAQYNDNIAYPMYVFEVQPWSMSGLSVSSRSASAMNTVNPHVLPRSWWLA